MSEHVTKAGARRLDAVCRALGLCLGCLAGHGVWASQITMSISDSVGAPVPDAVVALFPLGGATATSVGKPPIAMDQVKKQFVPHVLAIEVGTTLYFPNSDNIRHQVYSFSDAKRFELRLYSGKTAAPVMFDQPGLVVLGCNIHDWMSAYVYVLPTSLFAMTDREGHAALKAPIGSYTVRIWHPRYAHGRDPVTRPLELTHDSEALTQTLTLAAEDDSPGVPPKKQ